MNVPRYFSRFLATEHHFTEQLSVTASMWFMLYRHVGQTRRYSCYIGSQPPPLNFLHPFFVKPSLSWNISNPPHRFCNPPVSKPYFLRTFSSHSTWKWISSLFKMFWYSFVLHFSIPLPSKLPQAVEMSFPLLLAKGIETMENFKFSWGNT